MSTMLMKLPASSLFSCYIFFIKAETAVILVLPV